MSTTFRDKKQRETPKDLTALKMDGTKGGAISLAVEVFGQPTNGPLMHQVVVSQLAARRAGTQSTKTRGEVSGGGAKPFRQKGTGRARQGSTRSPQFVGGGVALGPKPRSYEQKTPRKMVRLALYSALSTRHRDHKIVVAEDLQFEKPSTKAAVQALASWHVSGRVLVVLGDADEKAYLAFRNLPNVQVAHVAELAAYDVLRSDYVVFTTSTLSQVNGGKQVAEKKVG